MDGRRTFEFVENSWEHADLERPRSLQVGNALMLQSGASTQSGFKTVLQSELVAWVVSATLSLQRQVHYVDDRTG